MWSIQLEFIFFFVCKTFFLSLTLCNTFQFCYTGCHRRNGPNFGRVFLMLNYTDITQNTYVPS